MNVVFPPRHEDVRRCLGAMTDAISPALDRDDARAVASVAKAPALAWLPLEERCEWFDKIDAALGIPRARGPRRNLQQARWAYRGLIRR